MPYKDTEKRKQYFIDNKERISKVKSIWYQNHKEVETEEEKEHKRQYNRYYYQSNIKKIKEQKKGYRIDHREEIQKKGKQRYQNNKKEILYKQRQYDIAHPEQKKERGKKWYIENREEELERVHNRYQNNKEEILVKQNQYNKEHADEIRKRQKQYYKTPEGKLTKKKAFNKRERELGYAVLNPQDVLENVGHHLDKINVINIPGELHRSISHSVFTEKNLNEINIRAWDYLEASVL